ncbi:MAG: putative toxin-antitoxin system toxin component, PIN family [Candidatus Tectomicrobia bacterium]|uniref:Toxin-antitoxin system toxin component, PIN family n=1 Tax=Tectimicrobiota bacterium TaxID=2528274 RepID=A0A932GSB4_UNCTE|nr:putative toxin-antitoxin system toxin component, PIN family [Candidatus Tectomicrobia bacterium]
MRIVVDTNVLISAAFWTGKPKELLNRVRQRRLTFLTSEVLLDELREVLVREDKPFKLSAEEAARVVAAMRDIAEIVQPHSRVTICQDDQDNRVLECAMDGSAECIISGDLHLLGLKSFQGIQIMTVSDFLSHSGPRS